METTAVYVFWISLGLITLPLALYPVLLYLLAAVTGGKGRTSQNPLPRVSCLVAARNEAHCIGARIQNLLLQDYPQENLEILVGSDASSDETDRIVQSYASRGVRLHRSETRVGKSDIILALRDMAAGDVLVMTDANTVFRSDTVRQLVEPFGDPEVGCVDGSRRNSLDVTTCESAYWRYETLLKRLCGRLGAVLGTTGAVFAVRKAFCKPAGPKRADDFELGVMVRMQGKRCVFNEDAVALEPTEADASQYRRSVRITAQYFGMAVRFFFMALFRGRIGLALQLLVHKILRWQIGVFALLATAALFALRGVSPLYSGLWAAALAFHAWAIVGWLGRRKLPTPLLLPYYFWLMGVSALHGMGKLLLRGPTLIWDPQPRS